MALYSSFNLKTFRSGMKPLFLLALLIFLTPSARAMEVAPSMQKVELPNGMTAIVKESHRIPVAAVQVWVKAGSVYESQDQAGITHLIEHMIFKGTSTRGPGEIAGSIEAIGGRINAYTSLDYTVYHCTVPSQYLDVALDILSDAVFHSVFDRDELEREKKVVLEEMRMRHDRPATRLHDIIMKESYSVYPYKRPVIGYPETVKAITRDDILDYVKQRYVPSNVTVIVAGDVDAAKTLGRIQEKFGSIPSRNPGEFVPPMEPKQRGPRLEIDRFHGQEAYLAVSFSGIPSFNSDDTPVLDVLAALLSDGESARLVSRLRDRMQLVHSIDAYSFTPAGPGLFSLKASLDAGKVNEAISAILQELFRLQNEEVLQEELDRAKIQVETDFVYSQETMEGEARKIGVFEMLTGDPAAQQRYLEKVRAVTPEEIQAAARKYFRENNVNVAILLPPDVETSLDSKSLMVMVREAELEAQGLEPGDVTTSLATPVKRVLLSNGMTLLVQEAHEVPTVAFRIIFPGGVRYETKETNGIFKFIAAMWTRGTTQHSAQGLAQVVEGMGGSISGFSGMNTFGLSARFLSSTLDRALPILAEVLMSPSFPTEEVERMRPLLLAQLKEQDDSLSAVAFREFRRLLFSPHPYGMNPLGTVESIQSITRNDLVEAYSEFARPDRGVISVVGDVDTDQLVNALETLIGGWSSPDSVPLPADLPEPRPLSEARTLSIQKQKQQVHIVLGFPGTTLDSPDRFALDVLNAILAGQGGRLFTHLRDEDSLAYTVTALNSPGLDYGSFALYIACAPEKRRKAIKKMWEEIYSLMKRRVSDKELDRAKKWLTGTYTIGLQTNGAKAMDMGLNELYGLGFNFGNRYIQEIAKVTAEDVIAAANKVFSDDAYVLVQIGPE